MARTDLPVCSVLFWPGLVGLVGVVGLADNVDNDFVLCGCYCDVTQNTKKKNIKKKLKGIKNTAGRRGSGNRLRLHGMSKSQTKYIITNSQLCGTVAIAKCNCCTHDTDLIAFGKRAQQVAETLAQKKKRKDK